MIKGFRVRVKANKGTATANKPSPLADMPVAHQSRLNVAPSDRRPAGAAVGLLGAPTVPDEPDAARSTDANRTTSQNTGRPNLAPTKKGAGGRPEGTRASHDKETRLAPRSSGASVSKPEPPRDKSSPGLKRH
jgi:hypothetical protein